MRLEEVSKYNRIIVSSFGGKTERECVELIGKIPFLHDHHKVKMESEASAKEILKEFEKYDKVVVYGCKGYFPLGGAVVVTACNGRNFDTNEDEWFFWEKTPYGGKLDVPI